jgi:transcriptional regulator with XRE-family HTH domain
MSDFGREIGERLVKERERLGLSRVRFAELAGVHANTQANYETGKRVPDAAYFDTVRQLEVNVEYVMNGQCVRKRLIDLPETYCSDVFADYWLLVAYQIEDSLLAGGAEAGKDYNFRDLWELAQPFVKLNLSQLRLGANDRLGCMLPES